MDILSSIPFILLSEMLTTKKTFQVIEFLIQVIKLGKCTKMSSYVENRYHLTLFMLVQ